MNVRRPTPNDAGAVTELIRTVEAAFGEVEQSQQDLEHEWADIDLDRDAWLYELDGRLAGYGALYSEGRPIMDGYVHPDARRRGVGSRLVAGVEDEARRRGLETLQNAVFAADDDAQSLLRSRGYREARRYYRMTIELDAPPPASSWPTGLEVAPVEPSGERQFHAALDEAFAEEWGHEPERDVDWASIRERRHPDRSLWFAVTDGDDVAAAAVCDGERWGGGWIAAIGVRKPWRRRGLGFALLLHCFGELYARGQRRIGLGVDAQNPTGATRLYERAGMRVAFAAVFFAKELA